MTKHLLLVGFAALAAACSSGTDPGEGKAARSASIVGGTPTKIEAWPGTVQLRLASIGPGCGGTLVADAWVLTAAHCLLDPQQPNGGVASVMIGRERTSSTAGVEIPVLQAIPHERFGGPNGDSMDSDIALLRLAQPATGQPLARIITAAEWQANAQVGGNATVVGWGHTFFGGELSDVLREVTVPLVDHNLCRQQLGHLGAITQNMLCAGFPQGGRDACQGDSGGPLFLSVAGVPSQIGIVSFGEGCAAANRPGVYTRVVNFLDWITQRSGGAVVPGATAPAQPPVEQAPELEPAPDDDSADESTTSSVEEDDFEDEEDVDEDEPTPKKKKKKKKKSAAMATAAACSASPGARSSGAGGLTGILGLALLGMLQRRRTRSSSPT